MADDIFSRHGDRGSVGDVMTSEKAMRKKKYDEETKRIADLLEKILEDKEGRELFSIIHTSRRESDRCKREQYRWDSKALEAEMKIYSKFQISHADWMNIILGIDFEGLEQIWKEHKVHKVVS